MADYFDRLLARHVPTPGGRPVLLRPRLPGPFERTEALHTELPQDAETAALLAPAPQQAAVTEVVRREREIRTTEQHTVIRTETPRTEGVRPAEPEPRTTESGLVQPATPLPRVPAADPPRVKAVQQRDDGERPASLVSGTTGAPPTHPAVLTPSYTAREPSTSSVAARAAAAARRADQRRAERVVHVEIGRLEVSAARPDKPAAPARSQRREPTLSLADYLSDSARGN